MADPRPDPEVLAPEALRAARAAGAALGFDPVRQGWVRLDGPAPEPAAAAPEPAAAAGPLAFRPWTEADVAVFRALLDDPEVWRWLPEPYPAPLSEALARDLLAVARIETHHEVRAVLWQGQPVGQVRLQWDPARAPGTPAATAEISYWLGRAHWGRGIGRMMLARAVPAAFDRHPRLTALWARVHPDNRASARILEAAGFARDPAPRPDGWLTFRHPKAPRR